MPKGPGFLDEDASSTSGSDRGDRLGAASTVTEAATATEASTVTATDAKNEFGRVLEKAIQGGIVVITKHDQPKAVLMSVQEFHALTSAGQMRLDTLSGEFDALLARMQKPAARAAMKSAFEASPKQMGEAAVAAARKRG